MAMGTSVFRIRTELIFRRCWNLITPWRSAGAPPSMSGVPRILGRGFAGASRRLVNQTRTPYRRGKTQFSIASCQADGDQANISEWLTRAEAAKK